MTNTEATILHDCIHTGRSVGTGTRYEKAALGMKRLGLVDVEQHPTYTTVTIRTDTVYNVDM